MTAKKRRVDSGDASQPGPPEGRATAGREADSVDARGPQSPAPWGSAGGTDRDAPWGASEDSPLDEGSEPTAVSEGRRGERRAGRSSDVSGRHGFGPVEPTRVGEAGPGGAPDAAPSRRPFPDESATGDVPDNPLERQTGMRPEGVARRE